ncbi:hypothetical protein OPV22_013945 [Ensete ventricosum]|uniref:Uncharacterized protein n=1 Tax=Ensete ventricosum TaxID=4639 RepID=A0AAV8R267_ENSVE|nr:hypothetical protein OPV22_013945 [Ensete ventricosum]
MFPSSTSYAAWILHQVPPKLLRLLIYIELMVALMPTITQVSPPLSSISTSTLSVPSYDVVMVAPPLDLVMHPPMHYFIRDHATTPRYSLDLLSFVEILSGEVLCPVGATFLFAFFPLEVSETTIPFRLLRLTEQLVPCSTLANALARL